MKSLTLRWLALVLTVGTLLGCSRISRKSSDASDGILAGREIAESRQPKPSSCIKRDNGSAKSTKPLRKTKGASSGRDQQKELQAKTESQSHI